MPPTKLTPSLQDSPSGNASEPSAFASGSTLGLLALRDELAAQGVSDNELLADTRVDPDWFRHPDKSLAHGQRLAIIRNAWRLAKKPDTALRAGRRQRISDFGLFGYAMASSPTFADALRFGMQHLELAGPVIRISVDTHGDVLVFRSHNPQTLGSLLPFAAEFWRSSMSTLMSLIMERPFPNRAMFFPYAAPTYIAELRKTFDCPLHFNADRMEWHVDAGILNEPCPNASTLTAKVCTNFCDRVLASSDGQTPLQREIRLIFLGYSGRYPTAREVAAQLGLSSRSLFRRLDAEGASFQALLDDIRRSVAFEYLAQTHLTIEEIGFRVGFADSANFRKAFRKWSGSSPSAFRKQHAREVQGA